MEQAQEKKGITVPLAIGTLKTVCTRRPSVITDEQLTERIAKRCKIRRVGTSKTQSAA